MTDQAATTGQTSRNSGSRWTRRQLLVGGTGALAPAVTAETVACPAPASAANGNSVILGQGNIATTHIQNGNNSSAQAALHGIGTGATNGLSGISERGNGVLGGSNSGTGVSGSTNGIGTGV
jgi:hypothetical protein